MSDTEISLLLLGETFRTKFWRCWEKKKRFFFVAVVCTDFEHAYLMITDCAIFLKKFCRQE